jgi:serine/threonine protein kinase
MEYVPGGDLGSLIGEKGPLPELDVKAMAGQLLSALKYLHEGGITHRDVKPDNILISSRDPFVAKLTDFGLSKMIDSEETFLRTFCGTLLYCAPEVYSEYREYDQTGKRNLRGLDKKSLPPQRYGHAVDVWSLAGVLFYALCGSPPYPVKNGTSYQELLNQIMTQPLDIRPLQRSNISENGIRFVRNMLHVRPEYRATIDELERSSWLCGGDSMDVSMEEDEEVDMIGGSFIDPELEEGTSQLSIQNSNDEVSQEEEMGDGVSDLTEVQQIEIPNSFSSSNSEGNESFGFMRGNGNPGNGRLFGEVNASALGSSGAIPDELSLPIPAMNHRATLSDLSEDSRDTESDPGNGHLQIESSSRHPNLAASATMPNTMPPPPPPHIPNVAKQTEIDEQFTRSSSLGGAESMVGHLNVHSPSSAASPAAESPATTTETGRDTTVSLRRPREEDVNEDGSWEPADLPAKRRRRSEREIDLLVPPSIFWDPKDKSTHHTNYPRMSHSDFLAYQEYAETKGELFRPGQKTFEMTMQSFRMSRSPSIEPEVTRAHSEPTKEEGKRMMMKRDERNLAEDSSGPDATPPNTDLPTHDELLPSTAHPSKASTIVPNSSVVPSYSQPVVGNDFQPPKRILAKVIATSDSCLPTITLNITDSLTSWGRGYDATVRYSNGNEIRIPKYAFKILLFKPGYYTAAPSSRNAQAWNDQDQDMRFYISTKASQGIYINGIYVRADDHQYPATFSRYWGELRHGDLITVWRNEPKPQEFTRFRFECYWGKSKEPRKEEEVFQLLEEGEFLTELEQACLKQEKDILTEQRRRDEEERKAMEEEKEVEKAVRKGGVQPANFSQSFSGVTSTTS